MWKLTTFVNCAIVHLSHLQDSVKTGWKLCTIIKTEMWELTTSVNCAIVHLSHLQDPTIMDKCERVKTGWKLCTVLRTDVNVWKGQSLRTKVHKHYSVCGAVGCDLSMFTQHTIAAISVMKMSNTLWIVHKEVTGKWKGQSWRTKIHKHIVWELWIVTWACSLSTLSPPFLWWFMVRSPNMGPKLMMT